MQEKNGLLLNCFCHLPTQEERTHSTYGHARKFVTEGRVLGETLAVDLLCIFFYKNAFHDGFTAGEQPHESETPKDFAKFKVITAVIVKP